MAIFIYFCLASIAADAVFQTISTGSFLVHSHPILHLCALQGQHGISRRTTDAFSLIGRHAT
jgi:hypothetical protein